MIGFNGSLLTSNGQNPTWTSPNSLVVGRANNITGGVVGGIPYQFSIDTTAYILPPVAGITSLLVSSGPGNNIWTPLLAILGVGSAITAVTAATAGFATTAGAAVSAGTINGGGTNDILYQTATSATGFISSSNGFLMSDGGKPAFSNAVFKLMDSGTPILTFVQSEAQTTGPIRLINLAGTGTHLTNYDNSFSGGYSILGFSNTSALQEINHLKTAIQALKDGFERFDLRANDGTWFTNSNDTTVYCKIDALGVKIPNLPSAPFLGTDANGLLISKTAPTSTANITGGVLGDIPVQTAPNTTSFIRGPPASTSLLTHDGTNASFITTALTTVGKANNIAGGSTNTLVYQTAANTTAFINSTPSSILEVTSGGVIQFAHVNSISVGYAGYASTTALADRCMSIEGGLADNLVYQSAAHTTAFLGGVANTVLTRNATNQLEFTARSAMSVGSSTNIVGGVANQIPYQTGVSTTAFITGGVNKILTTNASGVPTFVSNLAITSDGLDDALKLNSSGPNTAIRFNDTTKAKRGFTYLRADPANASNVMMSMRVDNGVIERNLDIDEAGSITLPITSDNKYVSAPLLGTDANRKIIRVASSVGSATNVAGGVANQIPYQTGVSTTAFITGGANKVLTTNASGVPTFVSNPIFTYSASSGGNENITLRAPGSGINPGIEFANTGLNKFGYVYMRADPANAANVVLSMRVNGSVIRQMDVDEAGSIILPVTDDNKYVSAPLLGTGTDRKITRVSPTSLSVGSATNIVGGVANQIPYQTGVSTTAFITGGANRVLTTNASGVPTFVTNLTLTSPDTSDVLTLNSPGAAVAIRFNDTTKAKNGFVYLRADPTNSANVMMTMRVDNGVTTRTLDINEAGSIILPPTDDNKYVSATLLKTDANRMITPVSFLNNTVLISGASGGLSGLSGGVNATLQTNGSGVPTFVSNPIFAANGTTDAVQISSPGAFAEGFCAIRLNQTTRNRFGYVHLKNNGATEMTLNLQLNVGAGGGGGERILSLAESGVVSLPTTTDNRYVSAGFLATDANRGVIKRNLNNYRYCELSANCPWPNATVTTMVNWFVVGATSGTALNYSGGEFQNPSATDTIAVQVSLTSASVNNGFGEREFHIVKVSDGRRHGRQDVRGVDIGNVSATVLLAPGQGFILTGYQNSGVGLDFDASRTTLTISWVG